MQESADLEFTLSHSPSLLSTTNQRRRSKICCHIFAQIYQGGLQKEEVLPISVFEGGRKKRYVWTGKEIKRRELNDQAGRPRLQNFFAALQDAKHSLHRAFFPKQNEVTEDYWAFVCWRAGHRLSSAMLGNFATQSLLAAVGVGAKHQMPAAASINWLLKDGLGRLGRLCVAACLGHRFDSDLKQYRWMTSLTFTGATALEFIAPLMPHHFLILASIANVGKAVGITTYVATHPAFMRSFACGDNLADINAKGQAQQMVMDTLGLALCVGLTYAVRNSNRGRIMLPLVMFPFLAAADLLCIYKELKATHLRSLNQERCEILTEEWLHSGAVLSPQAVSAREQLTLPRRAVLPLPLSFVTIDKLVQNPRTLMDLLMDYREQDYVLTVRQGRKILGRSFWKQSHNIAVALREGAASKALITAILQAEILRFLSSPGGQANVKAQDEVLEKRSKEVGQSPLLTQLNRLPPDSSRLSNIQHESFRLAQELVIPFSEALRKNAWQTDGFLNPPDQKDGFILDN